MAESPKKGSGNTLILGLILCLIFGVVGYVVYDKYLKGKLAIGTGGNTNLNTGNGSGDTTTPTVPTLPTTPAAQSNTVIIEAINNADPYPRDFNIFTQNPDGKYLGGGVWSIGEPIRKAIYGNGGRWELNLASGTYYLLIGQSGGSGYGTYSGVISVNGASIPFAGADVNHSVRFTVP